MIVRAFQKQFQTSDEPRVFRAPGRVNLIGEHTDYNLGFVLPIALDLACFVASAPSTDGALHLASEEKNETRSWKIEDISSLQPSHDWTDYVIGVAQLLEQAGQQISPARLFIHSTVPEGSGLSSSAALEVSSALAFLGGRPFDGVQLAQLCQKAEIEFVGMPCGIMDQYVSIFGKPGAAVEIDCRSLTHEFVGLPRNAEILAVNSMVKHELAQSAYRERTEQCAMAVDVIRGAHPEVRSLRDVSMAQFEALKDRMPKVIARRARHVISEIERVGLFVNAARRGDLERMGQLFVESHLSLQHDYEVSAAELDFLVNTAIGIEGVHGARMTGGGFGGSTVNLLRPDASERFQEAISNAYRDRFGVTPQIFVCRPSAGAGEASDRAPLPGRSPFAGSF